MKDAAHNSGRWKIIAAVAVILAALLFIPSARFDWLNIFAGAAVLYLAACIGRAWSISSASGPERKLWSVAGRSVVIIILLLASGEFFARAASLHRSLVYESHGDLLFTPTPNQEYIEKISMTQSRTDQYGLRAGVSPAGRTVILCLGDSITYGYGVDDQDTYPMQLQHALDQYEPGKYAVLNGGVDAYPIWLMHERFVYLWNRGIQPALVIVGYSMNEGWLGQLRTAGAATKAQFKRRVKLKNFLRHFALYNLVVENWARSYYDRIKGLLVPGTHSLTLGPEDLDAGYERALDALLTDLRTKSVPVVFVLFCSFDHHTKIYDANGPFQKRFAAFAEEHSIPLFSSVDALRAGLPASRPLSGYFIDDCHMNSRGTDKFGHQLALFLETGKFFRHDNVVAATR
jgi:lysophospholipase L1-like esterase